jgi:predicted ATP-dependent serine protease
MNRGNTLSGVVPSGEFNRAQFAVMELKPAWASLLGQVSPNFTLLVHGPPGNGKSTFCYLFAGYLARHHGPVLYVAQEEKNGYTVKEKVVRLNLAHQELSFADSFANAQREMGRFSFVVIDSLQAAELTLPQVRALLARYPDKGFVFVSQNTKAGQARGSLEIQHDVDIVLKAELGLISNLKNRFGGTGTLNVFDR